MISLVGDHSTRLPLCSGYGSCRLSQTLQSVETRDLTLPRYLASIGALITILALALGPFFQQSVRYDTVPAVDPIQRAQAVTARTWGVSLMGWAEVGSAC